METILPILVAAVVFGFQIYANFKKEQEKARKRNPSQKAAPEKDGEESRSRRRPAKAVPPRELVLKDSKTNTAYEAYTGTIQEVEQVKRASASRKSQGNSMKRLEAFVLAEDEEKGNNAAVAFDLRDAVIKAAILERPHK